MKQKKSLGFFISLLFLCYATGALADTEWRNAGDVICMDDDRGGCKQEYRDIYYTLLYRVGQLNDEFGKYGFMGLQAELEELQEDKYRVEPATDEEAKRMISELNALLAAYNAPDTGYMARFHVLRDKADKLNDFLAYPCDIPCYSVLREAAAKYELLVPEGRAEDIEGMIRLIDDAFSYYYERFGAEASGKASVDCTSFVAYPKCYPSPEDGNGFEYPDYDANWHMTGGFFLEVGGDSALFIHEVGPTVSSSQVYQDITGLPNGYYKFSASMAAYKDGCLTNPHLYATSSEGGSESPVLSRAIVEIGRESKKVGFDVLETGLVAVSDGKLRIGAVSDGCYSEGPWGNQKYIGSFFLRNARLTYHGRLEVPLLQQACRRQLARLQVTCDRMCLNGDRRRLQGVIDAHRVLPDDVSALDNLSVELSEVRTEALKSIKTQANLYGEHYRALKELLENKYLREEVREVILNALSLMDGRLAADDVSWVDIEPLHSALRTYSDTYIPALTAALSFKMEEAEAQASLRSFAEAQADRLASASSLPSAAELAGMAEALDKAVYDCSLLNIVLSGSDDYTSAIVNANWNDGNRGWSFATRTKTVESGYCLVDVDNENIDWERLTCRNRIEFERSLYYAFGAANTYITSFTASQAVRNIPNGTYELGVNGRNEATIGAEGLYLFAVPDGDEDGAVFCHMHRMPTNLGELEGMKNPDGSDKIVYSTMDKYGTIWADALWRVYLCTGIPDPEDVRRSDLNGGWGDGYNKYSLTVEVKNHELTLGVTIDTLFMAGRLDTEGKRCIPFSGNQFSADNFTLTLLESGDNTGWSPVTGIDAVEREEAEGGCRVLSVEYFSLSGMKSVRPHKGVNIVRRRMSDGSVRTEKVYVK